MLLIELANGGLDLAQLVFDRLHLVAGNLADLLPATLDGCDALFRLSPVGLREKRFRLCEQLELECEVGFKLDAVFRVDLGLRGVQHVTRGLELGPERIVKFLACATGELPLVEERSIGRHTVGALGGKSLCLFDELLLLVAGILVHRVELGEEGLAVSVDNGAGILEALPEIVALGLRKARAIGLVLLPAGEDVVEGGRDLLPLGFGGVLGGERLGFDHDCRANGNGLLHGGLGLFGLLLGELTNGAAEGLETSGEGRKVANSVGCGHGCRERLDGFRNVGSGGATLRALFEQRHLTGELGELALKVGESLFWGAIGVLADRSLARSLAHEDSACLVNATPWSLIV